MAAVEGFSLERNEADTAMVIDERADEPVQGQEEEVVEEKTVLGGLVGEEAVKTYTENPEFLLNPAKMTNQGKIVFYMNMVVMVLVVLSAVLGGKFNMAVVLLAANIAIMAFLHANVINCMIVGNCNVYSTILTVLNVFGQVLLVSALVYFMLSGKK
jgi:hypothetical protein